MLVGAFTPIPVQAYILQRERSDITCCLREVIEQNYASHNFHPYIETNDFSGINFLMSKVGYR